MFTRKQLFFYNSLYTAANPAKRANSEDDIKASSELSNVVTSNPRIPLPLDPAISQEVAIKKITPQHDPTKVFKGAEVEKLRKETLKYVAQEKGKLPLDDDDDYEISYDPDKKKHWKQSGTVPLGLFGCAVLLGSAIVYKGRGSGKGIAQRIMEARVMSQAVAVTALVGAGLYFKSKGDDKRPNKE
jgi:hypothetical protein